MRRHSSYIAFIASRMNFGEHVRPDDWRFCHPANINAAMIDGEVIVTPLIGEAGASQDTLLGNDPRPDWLRLVEIIEIGPNVAEPDADFYDRRYEAEEDDETEDEAEDDFEWAEARDIVRELWASPEIERPTFGRRMLLVWTVSEEHQGKRIDKALESLKGSLGPDSRAVWHGSEFRAFAFCDARKPEDIARGLRRHLEGEFIWDWIIVELAAVAKADNSFLSPLTTWMQTAGRARRT